MLYFIGLGLVGAKDITVKGLEIEDYGRKLILADRDMVEQKADELLKESEVSDVEYLVVGDPFVDMVLREVNAGIQCRVIHNASTNAVECCGLQLYNFGETVSIVFWTDTWRPERFYVENLYRVVCIHHPVHRSRLQTVSEVAMACYIKQADRHPVTEKICVGLARVGAEDQVIRMGTLCQLVSCDLVDMLCLSAVIPDILQDLMTDISTYSS
uniref:Diphthamide biosynthesis 5 n=1 Tax=Salmo trutta TaxID=8032 RepID=A0A674DXI2_SALTR